MRLRVWCLIPIYKSYHIPKNKLYTCPTLVENVVLQVPFLWCNSILGSLSFWLPQGPCCVWISLKFIIFYVLDSFIICIKTPCWLGNEFFLVVTILYFCKRNFTKSWGNVHFQQQKKSPLLWDQKNWKKTLISTLDIMCWEYPLLVN